MLAPIRDYLSPKDPKMSPLLCATKDHYFRRLSVFVDPGHPGFEEARWIKSEDGNVEHLLDVFTLIDAASDDVWLAYGHFLGHLYWHNPRQTLLGQRVEDLPDDHPSKPVCLFELSRLLDKVGKFTEEKELLIRALKLERERGNDARTAQALRFLCDTNRMLGQYEEGMEQVREALQILERIGDVPGQAICLVDLGQSLLNAGQLDAAEETASRAIDLISGEGQPFVTCRSHRILGNVYHAKGERGKAIENLKTAIAIASPFEFHGQLFWIHWELAEVFLDEGDFDSAQVHANQAESHIVGDTHSLGYVMEMRAKIWRRQNRLEDARAEVLHAMEVYEKFGLSGDLENCRALLQEIERDRSKNKSI